MISFCGKYVNDLQIYKRNCNGEYLPHTASFVKLNPENKNDVKALGSAVDNWDSYKFFGSCIHQNMLDQVDINKPECFKQQADYYIATTQLSNFEKLDSDKIIGAIEVQKKDFPINARINLFEIKPEYCSGVVDRGLKGIGSSMLNSVENMYEKFNIFIVYAKSSLNFYLKRGYKYSSNVGILSKFKI